MASVSARFAFDFLPPEAEYWAWPSIFVMTIPSGSRSAISRVQSVQRIRVERKRSMAEDRFRRSSRSRRRSAALRLRSRFEFRLLGPNGDEGTLDPSTMFHHQEGGQGKDNGLNGQLSPGK